MNKPDYLTKNDWDLLNKKYTNMSKIIKKLNKNYPVQYLIGNVNFYGYDFIVNKHVLIPRFETETLIEKTLAYINKYDFYDNDCLEIGTGSGCIAITMKKESPKLNITSVDISRSALKVANKNAKLNKTSINFIHKNIYRYKPINKYSIIISNPPYIAYDEEIDPKTKYEPQKALYAKNKGLAFYEYIIRKSKKWLHRKSMLAFEIGEKQGPSLKKLAKEVYPKAKIMVEKDLAGKNRYLFIINV